MSHIRKLQFIILINYAVVGSILSFTQGGIAPILHKQGITLSSMSWVFALYLPFGLAFIWAPLLERLKPRLNYRKQIFTAQIIATGLLLFMAILSTQSINLALLWGLALLLNFIIASLDLALDGFSSLSCQPEDRPSLAGTKMAGISLGALIGGGVLVGQFSVLHWSGVFTSVAGLALLSMPFIAMLNEPQLAIEHHKGLGLTVCWKDHDFRAKLWRVALLSCCIMALFNLNRLLLVGIGLPLKSIGMYLGTLTPLGSFVLAFLMPTALRKFSHSVVYWGVIVSLLCTLTALIVVIHVHNLHFALVLSIIIGCLCSGFMVILGSIILGWAKSAQSATDYALLYGLGRLCAACLLIALPPLIAILGWQIYYALMIGGLLIAVILMQKFIP